jgi:hypothetical protein
VAQAGVCGARRAALADETFAQRRPGVTGVVAARRSAPKEAIYLALLQISWGKIISFFFLEPVNQRSPELRRRNPWWEAVRPVADRRMSTGLAR